MPGVRSVLGLDPLEAARDTIASRSDQDRRVAMARRVELLNDDVERTLREECSRIFSRERRARLDKLIRLGGAINLFRRIVDEVARPVYSPPPLRTIYRSGDDAGLRGDRRPGPDQGDYLALARECRLDAKLSLAARLVYAANACALGVRYSERLGLILDVLAPSEFSVIPDPDDPTGAPLALMYQLSPSNRREDQAWAYWDADEAFVLDARGRRYDIADAAGNPVKTLTAANGHPGILPFVVVHRSEHNGCYWDNTGGQDIANGQRAIGVLVGLMLNLLKTQGHQQLAMTNGSGMIPQTEGLSPDQLLDPESAVISSEGSLSVLYTPTPIDHFARAIDILSSTIGANHGLTRDRMNQTGQPNADMAGLLERRAEAIVRFADAEQLLFDVMRVVSRAHPRYSISDDARLLVDYAEISTKVERSKVLDVWEREIAMGLRNPYDCIREDQPEIRDDDEARAEITRNAEARAWKVQLERALNVRTDGTMGQTPEQNGAMGTEVRDGHMSKDEAADHADSTLDPEPPAESRNIPPAS